MEPNSSTVCVATTNDHQSTQLKLQQDDTMPLYATIMPSSSRKMR